jgi:hypothetical protein
LRQRQGREHCQVGMRMYTVKWSVPWQRLLPQQQGSVWGGLGWSTHRSTSLADLHVLWRLASIAPSVRSLVEYPFWSAFLDTPIFCSTLRPASGVVQPVL